ncbi:putative serine protease HhoB precursor [Moorella thermoacetica]|uniref:Putative serine protease HhoB n=1 Tax=Neomoorella thermoacetica TaxID=1525 RepID=A0A1J5P7Z1_NEOTH|nr:putative serine protease HhoB precursor [Moorella thermoacetica]
MKSISVHTVLAVMLSGLLIMAGGFGLARIYDNMHNQVVTEASKLGPIEENPSESAKSKDLKSIIAENQKLVVCLEVELDYGKVQGSGFLYNQQGDVITNAHVVGNARTCRVKLSDGTVYQGTVIGRGEQIDVALVRVPELAGKEPMKIARDRTAEVGDEVIALGSPLGLQNTATTGIISGVNRDLDIGDYHYKGLYQISAPISHGSSGGPLLDRHTGEVLGVNSAGAEGENIGFSIPITQVLPLVENWSKNPSTAPVQPTTGTAGKISGKELAIAASYLVEYFYTCVNSGDYVGAFALLGSDWQAKQPYENFRAGYLNTLSVRIEDLRVVAVNQDSAEISIIIEALERTNQGEERTSYYRATYQVGLENGKLKLLKGTASKIR